MAHTKTHFAQLFIFPAVLFFSAAALAQSVTEIHDTTDSTGPSNITRIKLVIHSAPAFTIQFSGNYDFGIYELSANDNGDFNSTEFVKGENFGVRHGIGANLTAKFPLHKRGNVRLNVSLMFNKFNSSLSKVMSQNNETEFARYNVYSLAAGIENNFTPNFTFKTFIGGGIVASLISGEARVLDSVSYVNLTVIPAFRLGLSFYSGLEYMLTENIGFNCGFMFTHANLWLKQTKQSSNPDETYLNDQKVTPRLPYSGFKQFAWGSFFCGANYYFGISKKEYIYKK